MRFAEYRAPKLKNLGSNHTDLLLHIDNSEGKVPFFSRDKKGHFEVPGKLLWDYGTSSVGLMWQIGMKHYHLFYAFCDRILGDKVITVRDRFV